MADLCNAEGANRVKEKVQDYWRERGLDVDVQLVDAGFSDVMRSVRKDVRSDMINGWPRGYAVMAGNIRYPQSHRSAA